MVMMMMMKIYLIEVRSMAWPLGRRIMCPAGVIIIGVFDVFSCVIARGLCWVSVATGPRLTSGFEIRHLQTNIINIK